MSQAIHTKSLPYTEHRGAMGIMASAQAGRLVSTWDSDIGIEQNHCAIARRYAERMNWRGCYVGGGAVGGGYVWVHVGDAIPLGFGTRHQPQAGEGFFVSD